MCVHNSLARAARHGDLLACTKHLLNQDGSPDLRLHTDKAKDRPCAPILRKRKNFRENLFIRLAAIVLRQRIHPLDAALPQFFFFCHDNTSALPPQCSKFYPAFPHALTYRGTAPV